MTLFNAGRTEGDVGLGEVYVAQPHGVLDFMENVPNMQNDAGIRPGMAAIGSSTAIAALMYLPFLV